MPTAAADAEIAALVVAHSDLRAGLTAQAVAMAAAQAQQFNGWYDSAAITVWAGDMAAQMEALQRVIAQTTDAYLARVLTQLIGAHVRPIGRVDVSELRTGVTHAGAYGRAADVYRFQQSQFDRFTRSLVSSTPAEPFDLANPIEAAVERVKSVADLDAQLADRAQTTAVYEQSRHVTGYRRVIHPEQSRGGSCGLCIGASDRLYGKHEPRPIHDRCHCTTLPVIEGADPGSTLNAADLRRLYREAGGTGRDKLKSTRYKVVEHGELGPVLTRRGAPFKVKHAEGKPSRKPKTDAQKQAEIRSVRAGLSGALPKARELAAADPKKWGDYLGKLEDRLRDLDQQLAA
jgi:hypothetical protein